MNKKNSVHIEIPASVHKDLKIKAIVENTTVSTLIRNAVIKMYNFKSA